MINSWYNNENKRVEQPEKEELQLIGLKEQELR